MICDVVTTKEVIEKSIARAEKLRETMEVTAEGEVLDVTIEVNKRALSLLNDRDFPALQKLAKEELVSNLATTLVTEQLGSRFLASIRNKPTSKDTKENFILKNVQHRVSDVDGELLELTVANEKSGKYGKYTFSAKGGNISSPSGTNTKRLRIPSFDMVFNRVVNTINGVDDSLNRSQRAETAKKHIAEVRSKIEEAKSMGELIGSSAKFKEEDFNYELKSKVKNYQHGDVEHMKNVLADLHAIGGRPLESGQYAHYDELLGKMHPKFFRDMDLFINENTEESDGWVNIDKDHIVINSSSNTASDMSNAEVYMHETIHTMTSWALRTSTPHAIRLKDRLHFLKETAAKRITWKNLQMADDSLSEKGARERYDYIFNSEHSDDEFLAFALTNKPFMDILKDVKIAAKDKTKEKLFDTIKNFFIDIMNSVMGNYKFTDRASDVSSEVHTLAFALAEINGKAQKDLEENSSMYSKLHRFVDNQEEKIKEFIPELSDNLFDKESNVTVPENMNFVQTMMFVGKVIFKSTYNHRYRSQLGRFLSMYGSRSNRIRIPGLDARGSIREVARSVLPNVNGHITTPVEFLGLKNNKIDLNRNTRVHNTLTEILNNFDKTLVDEEQEALTSVIMESNASTLFNRDKNFGRGYSTANIAKLMGSRHLREVVIAKLKNAIKKKSKDRANWIIGQAEGLGIYMATGEGHKAQNSNSLNIVKGFLSSERFAKDAKLLSLVEELASLTALNNQKPTDVEMVGNMLKSEEKGVRTVVKLYEAFKANSEKELFKGDVSHITEGYIKELFDDGIETAYAVMSKREEMEKQGFELISSHTSDDLSGAEDIGFFVSPSNTRAERLSGAVSLGNPGSRGMTLKEARYAQFGDSPKHAHIWFEADKVKHDVAAIEINKKLSEGVDVRDIEKGAVPVLDAQGNAVDYRNMMPKRIKAKAFKQNRKINDVLSKTAGTVVDKVAREEQNSKVLDFIKQQTKDIYDNPNSKDNELEYTLIGPDVEDPELRSLYYQLPKTFQQYAAMRSDKVLPIPSILMDQYFGYSHLRFTDLPGIKHLPMVIKRILNMVESVFMDIVKIAKGTILLKMPTVLVVNIVSNILYAVSTGTNPLDLLKAYGGSIRDVHNFMSNHKKVEAKTVELQALAQEYNNSPFMSKDEIKEYNDRVDSLKKEIKRLDGYMKESPVQELFDLGMYQSVIEDVSQYKLGDTNKVADVADRVVNKLPGVIKTPLQWMYLSKDTAWYKSSQYILQMSDLVARDVMNRKQKLIEKDQVNGKRNLPKEFRDLIGMKKDDKRKKLNEKESKMFLAMAEKSRHEGILSAFINYNKPNGKGEEYLNRIGVLMFTKYIKRIQTVISDVSINHPIHSTVTLLAAGFGMNLEMIQDSSFFTKVGDDYGLLGLTPVHDPLEVLMTVLNPPLIALGQRSVDGY